MQVNHANVQLYGELNYFVNSITEVITTEFKGRQSAKHIIESLGVPHTEVNNILINHCPSLLTTILNDGDYVEVFPWLIENEILSSKNIDLHFILDNHLGKLATYLRMIGIDTLYHNDFQDDEIVRSITENERILLTRDRQLLMRREIRWGYCIRKDNPKDQLLEVVDRFNLKGKIKLLSRCLICNNEILPIDKLEIIHRLEPLTKLYYEEFFLCNKCDKIYWKGSHYKNMFSFIQRL